MSFLKDFTLAAGKESRRKAKQGEFWDRHRVPKEKGLLLWIGCGQEPRKFICKHKAEFPGGTWLFFLDNHGNSHLEIKVSTCTQ